MKRLLLRKQALIGTNIKKCEHEILMHLTDDGEDYYLIDFPMGATMPWAGVNIHYTSPNYDTTDHRNRKYLWVGDVAIDKLLSDDSLKNKDFLSILDEAQPF